MNGQNETTTITSTTTTSNPFYAHYSQSGFSPPMVLMYGILAVICCAGICSNLILVAITIMSKSLHGRCNFLLAFNAFTSCGILFGYCVKFGVLFSGQNYIPLDLCYKLYFVPLIGLNLATTMQLCIGLDRLFSVLMPISYKTLNKFVSVGFHLCLCFARTIYYCWLIFNSVNKFSNQKKPVMCSTGDLVLPDIAQDMYLQSLVLFIAEFMSYALVWIVLLCRKSQAIKGKKLMVSLTVIMGLSLFCYIQGSIWRNILPYLHFDPFDMEYFVAYPSTLLYAIAFGSNLPVLVIFSSDYRQAFRTIFTGNLPTHPNVPQNRINATNASTGNRNIIQKTSTFYVNRNALMTSMANRN